MTRRFSRQGALGLVLLAPFLEMQAQPVSAAQAQPADTRDATASVEAHGSGDSAGRVSLQLFEFLGEFTTEDGEWVDPAILMEGDIVGSEQTGMGREGQETRGQGTDEAAARNDNCLEPRCEK
jgi:hypothetical protein